jgi:predicted DsbA family dithiol-disulfide isomerase
MATIVIWSDIGCPWARLAVERLHRSRDAHGLVDAVLFDHRAFPLELVNRRPTPKNVLDAEVPVVAAADAEVAWRQWDAPPWTWPVTTLPALEAVQAAKEQGIAAAERLDLALRRALFAQSRCVSMRSVVLDVADEAEGVEVEPLADALDTGRACAAVIEQWRAAEAGPVKGSPHLFLPDGSDVPNPGIEMHWEGGHDHGCPVVDRDDPSVYDAIFEAARSSVG